MIPRKFNIAKGLMLALASYPQLVLSEGFTAGDVLEWDRESQEAYIQNSVSMIVAMTSQREESRQYANCVSDWYSVEKTVAETEAEIIAVWDQYRDYHPQTVILAVVQQECGKVFP